MKFYLKSNDKILCLRWIKKLSGCFSGKPDLISVSLRLLEKDTRRHTSQITLR